MAVVHAAIYDAVNALDKRHKAYAIGIEAPPSASVESAAAAAAHGTLVRFFPQQQLMIDAILTASLAQLPEGQARTDGAQLGREVAEKPIRAAQVGRRIVRGSSGKSESTMPRYLVEPTRRVRALTGSAADGRAADHGDEVIRTNAHEGVTWIHSFVTPDRCRSYCIVDAPSPEAIRIAAQATALPVDRITEVRVCDPHLP